jgi:hypothetical protein
MSSGMHLVGSGYFILTTMSFEGHSRYECARATLEFRRAGELFALIVALDIDDRLAAFFECPALQRFKRRKKGPLASFLI